jgi:hypothetical protein
MVSWSYFRVLSAGTLATLLISYVLLLAAIAVHLVLISPADVSCQQMI